MRREAIIPTSQSGQEGVVRQWQLQEAKARLSELVKNAVEDNEPQEITLRGKPAAVVISVEAYQKLVNPKDKASFVEFMDQSPLRGSSIDLSRKDSFTRDTEFE